MPSYLACWIRRRGQNSEGRRGWQGQRGRGLGSRTDEATRPARAPVEGSLARGAGWERACGRPPPCRSRPPPCAGAALPRSRRPASRGRTHGRGRRTRQRPVAETRTRGLSQSRDAGCGLRTRGLARRGHRLRMRVLGVKVPISGNIY